jgi:hydroxyacylglutathione hydrolase
MILHHFLLDVNETNCYLAACSGTREAIILDPGEHAPELDAVIEAEGLRPVLIGITHDHYDHTGGVGSLVERYGATVVSRSGRISGIRGRAVGQGDVVELGQMRLVVLETPGHTPDSISFAVEDLIFTGDALFAGSVGGTSSLECFRQEIEHIRSRILSHAGSTRLFPGHGPPSTVAVETIYNPFLEQGVLL